MWNQRTLSLAIHVIMKQTHRLVIRNNERLDSQVVADEHQHEHSSLGTYVSHQSRGVSGLVADEHQSTVNPLVTRVHHGAASEDPSQEKPQMFDPCSLSTSNDFTFETHEVITQYLEQQVH